jgi:hypothetical protein
VGEKVIVEMPTFWFTVGVGINPENGAVTNYGGLDPLAAFRFAEPVIIEPQQNFRVEMSFPHDVPQFVKEAVGPIRVWVHAGRLPDPKTCSDLMELKLCGIRTNGNDK